MFRKVFLNTFFLMIIFLVACGTSQTNGTKDQNSNNQDEQNDQTDENNTDENNNSNEKPEVNLEDIKVNADSYISGDHAVFTIKLVNDSDQEIEVTFSSGQKYEIVVTDKEGEEVYRYSANKRFTQALETLTIPAKNQLSWKDQWGLQVDGSRVPAGEYDVKIAVKVNEVNGQSVTEDQFVTEDDLVVTKANSAFRNINVEKQDTGKYKVTGEARVFEGSFSYTVEDGHSYLIEETPVKVDEGAPSWSSFTIEVDIPKDQLPVNGALNLMLFERSAKDNSQVNVMPVQLDHIKQ